MSSDARQAAADAVRAETEDLADLGHGYPANHFAWRIVLDAASKAGTHSLIEVGVGAGNGIAHVVNAGLDFSGLDNKIERVEQSRALAPQFGVDPAAIVLADIEDAESLRALPVQADVLMALGILPTARDQITALQNMATLVRPGGQLFVECRNSLFSLVTFNRFTKELIAGELIGDALRDQDALSQQLDAFLDPRVLMDRPPLPASGIDPAQHNPLAIAPLFEQAGLTDISVHPFHFHAAMPALEQADPQGFRDASLALEDDTSGWRGLFLCSVFLVHAVRPA